MSVVSISIAMPTLHIFVIHTQQLKVRALHIHGVVQNVRLAALAENYDVNIRLILSPDASQLENRLQEVQNEINYDPVNDPQYDQMRLLLSIEMLSNTKKHQRAWQQISQMKDVHPDDLFLVLEDDAFVLPESIGNFRALLQNIRKSPWDVIVLGLTTNETSSKAVALRELSAVSQILPCKESYLITPAIAKRCLEQWTKHKFIMRVQWSYWFSQNPNVKVCIPSKRIFLDASKMGSMPSSIHGNNALVFNREYVELMKLASLTDEEVKTKLKEAERLFASITHLNSPDVLSIFGSILMKCGRYADAKKLYLQAIDILKMHNCIVRSNSDLYQQLVNLHEKLQTDVDSIKKNPSRYEDPTLALSDLAIVAS